LGAPFVSDRFTLKLFDQIQTLKERIRRTFEEASQNVASKAKATIHKGEPEEICSQIVEYLQWLEAQVGPLIARRSSIFWLCLDRRFPPGFDQVGDELRRHSMSQMFNIVKTLLFHKFGKAEVEPFTLQEDGSFDFDVGDEDIICLFGALRAYFHELAFVPNEYRRAAKGACPCTEKGIGLVTKMTPALEELVRMYDERRTSGNGGYLSTGGLGGFPGRELKPNDGDVLESLSTIAAIPTPGDHIHTIEGMGRIKSPGFDLYELALYRFENLRPFETRFEEVLGLTLDQLRACYVALKRYILGAWRPAAEYTLVSRGIWFATETTLRNNLIRNYVGCVTEPPRDTSEAEKTIERFLRLLEGNPRSCDLLLRQRQRSLSRSPQICALDLSITYLSLLDFLTDLTIDAEMKRINGNRFEEHVTETIINNVPSVRYPIRPGLALKRTGEKDPFAQVDTYAQVEDVLFLIESKAYSVTRDYLMGTPKAVTTRWELVQGWLRASDSRADKIVATHTGSNFSIPSDVKFVVPVICGAFSEFFWSDAEELYLRDGKIPRVCTLEELIPLMSGSLDSLRSRSCTIRI
jgi:hypothetical protein